MKIIINDVVKESINNQIINLDMVIKQSLKKEIPEIDIEKINVDMVTGKITYNYSGSIINLGYIDKNDDAEETIYLTTTEIRMLLRNSKTKINSEIVETSTLVDELKKHIPESSNQVLELHTHFIEVLDGKTFFELLVDKDPYFVDSNNKDKFFVSGKSYTKEELIQALEYPLDHLSGTKKDEGGIKTLAFSKLSEIVALRTNILKRDPRNIPNNGNEQHESVFNNDIGFRYGNELVRDSKSILIARIRELLIASLKKLESEGVNYVELSYSRSDISSIFDKPEKPIEPIKPVKDACDDYESEIIKYQEEYKKYEDKIKKYEQDLNNYEKFIKELNKIQEKGNIEFRFLLSTQRDDWHKTKINTSYCIPSSSEKIITKFLNKILNEPEKEKEKILKELIEHFINNVDKEKFKTILEERLKALRKRMNNNKVKVISDKIENFDINNPEKLLEILKDALKKLSDSSNKSPQAECILLYNILCEDLSFIQESQFDLVDLFKSEDLKSECIVGYDIMGYETKMSNAEKIFLEEKIQRIFRDYQVDDAKSGYSRKRIIRIHAGETRESSGNVLYILQLIKKIKSDPQFQDIANDFEFRIGHGVFIFDDQNQADEVIRLLVELDVIVELNLSSNYALDNVDEITDVPIQRFREGFTVDGQHREVKYVISTDGGGVYKTTVKQEGLLEHRYFPDSSTSIGPHNSPNNNSLSKEIEPSIDYEPETNSNNNSDSIKMNNEIEYSDDSDSQEQVLNEFKNLINIFYKDFNIENVLNFSEISSRMREIEKNIKDGNYKQAKLNIISCQIFMNCKTNFVNSLKKMKTTINNTKIIINNILDSNKEIYNSKIYSTFRLINQMSDRDLLINYYNIFEKSDLNKIINSISNSSNDKLQLDNIINDVDTIFISNVKSKFNCMDEDSIYRVSDSLMIKDGEDKSLYIDKLLDIIKNVIQSDNKELAKLKSILSPLNLKQLKDDLETKSTDDINYKVKELLIYDKTPNELSSILSLCYRSIIESGVDLSIEEFMRGEYGNDRKFKK